MLFDDRKEVFIGAATRDGCEPEAPYDVGGSIADVHRDADGDRRDVQDEKTTEKVVAKGCEPAALHGVGGSITVAREVAAGDHPDPWAMVT